MRVIDNIIGKEVLDSTAKIMGKIKDIDLNTASNSVESIIVTKGGLSESIGISKSEIVIPFEMINRIGDKVVLKKSINEAQQLLEELQYEDEI